MMTKKILVFRTDIKTKKKVKALEPLFNKHPVITDWSVDTGDIDNVLRIEALESLRENEVIRLIRTTGFYCEVMPD